MAKNNEKPKIDLGARFIAARKAAGIKQYALAKMLGVSEQTVRNWEHNRAKCTKHEHLAYYSKISGFSIDYLSGNSNCPDQATEITNMICDGIMYQNFEMAYLQAYYHIKFTEAESEKKRFIQIQKENGEKVYLSFDEYDAMRAIIHESTKAILKSFFELARSKTIQKPITTGGMYNSDYVLNDIFKTLNITKQE